MFKIPSSLIPYGQQERNSEKVTFLIACQAPAQEFLQYHVFVNKTVIKPTSFTIFLTKPISKASLDRMVLAESSNDVFFSTTQKIVPNQTFLFISSGTFATQFVKK